jgi:hypothetical protein
MMFLDCPAYLDEEGALRCGLPAEVKRRFTMRSTDGFLESVMIRCPSGHWFNGPIEFLALERRAKHDPGNAEVASSARRDRLKHTHDGLDGAGGFVMQESTRQREQGIRCPNDAPAYYLGRPAHLWITAVSPRRRRSTSNQLIGRETTCRV